MKDDLLKMVSSYSDLTPEEAQEISNNSTVTKFKKGTVLLKEGQVSKECYYVLKGCIREYYIVDGEEKTTAIFTEGQPVNSFLSYINKTPSKHFLVCVEDCNLTVGTEEKERAMCLKFPKLEAIIRSEMEKLAGIAQEEFATYMTSSPEKRYLNLLKTRPDLFQRIPQHQIASYIGVTPESLSRIRKRVVLKK